MSKKKKLTACPQCGSRNLLKQGISRKGRQIVQCAECDEEFEIYTGEDRIHRHRDDESDRIR